MTSHPNHPCSAADHSIRIRPRNFPAPFPADAPLPFCLSASSNFTPSVSGPFQCPDALLPYCLCPTRIFRAWRKPPAIQPLNIVAFSSRHPLGFADQSDTGNAKTRRSASRLAGFVSGPIYPVDFVFMPQTKEQIKNILQKFSLSGHGKNSRLFSINYAIILPYEGPVR